MTDLSGAVEMASLGEIFSETDTSTSQPSETPSIPNMIEEEKTFPMTDTEDSGHPSSPTHSQSSSSVVSEDSDHGLICPIQEEKTEKTIESTNISNLFGVKSENPQSKSLSSFRSVARSVLDDKASNEENRLKSPSDLEKSNFSFVTEKDGRISSAEDDRDANSFKQTSLYSNSSQIITTRKDLLQLPTKDKKTLMSGMTAFSFRSRQENDAEGPNRWQNAVRNLISQIFLAEH